MNLEIRQHIDNVLQEYTTEQYYERLLAAKDEYFSLTGKVNEDDDDYEARMSSFNEWYVFQYIARQDTRSCMKDYLLKNNIERELSLALLDINYSVFEYLGENLKKNIVLRDIFHSQKIVLPKGHAIPGLLKNDIFIGRIISYKGQNNLLDGIGILPKEVRPILKKQFKKVLKLNDKSMETKFLMQVEYLKNKWKHYGHIGAAKIFVFD